MTRLALACLLSGGFELAAGLEEKAPVGAAVAAAPGAKVQMQAKRKELVLIQKELEKTKAELDEFRRQEAALSQDMHKLESRDGRTRRRIAAIQNRIRQAESRRAALNSRIGALNLASGFWTSVLLSELRNHALIRAGREEVWGGRELWAEALRRAALMDKTRMIASLRGYRLKAEAAQEAARRAAAELQGKSRQAQAEERSVREQYERKQAAVAEVHGNVAAAEKRARELDETRLALTQLLARFGAAARYERKGPAGELPVSKNSLPWPVEGSVASPFGRVRNPELNTWAIHQGVTFAVRPGAAVSAVGSGRVIYAGPFRSYGKVLILDHGGGFFSIYGELGEIVKTKGVTVEQGEAIGTAGADDGGARGRGVVYLELRLGTEALDPMVWLRKI